MTKDCSAQDPTGQVSDRVFTLANLISVVRLSLIPAYLIFLYLGNDLVACVLFALAAGTDFVDGQIARRTHTVTRLGQILDPTVDRFLMIAGVCGLLWVGRLPAWIVGLVLIRDMVLLIFGGHLLTHYHIRVPVAYVGKFATTFLFVGFAGLLLNQPQAVGLDLIDISWLPGFNASPYAVGIWFIYIGLILSLIATAHYALSAWRMWREKRSTL